MALLKVNEIYHLKQGGRVRILRTIEDDGVLGIMAVTLDDIMVPDPYAQYPSARLAEGAWIGLQLEDLIIEAENEDLEHFLPKFDEVM